MRTMNRYREARKEKKPGYAFKTSTKGGALQASKSIIAGYFEKVKVIGGSRETKGAIDPTRNVDEKAYDFRFVVCECMNPSLCCDP